MREQRQINQPNQSINHQDKVITFDMKTDDNIRNIARNGYKIAKHFKDIGLKFKKIIPASTDISVRKLFKLPPESDLLCLEIDISNKSENDKNIMIGDIKDSLLLLENVRLISESPYKQDIANTSYRFLIKYTSPVVEKKNVR